MAFPSTGPPSGVFAEASVAAGTVTENMTCSIVPLPNGPLRDSIGNVVGIPVAGFQQFGTAHPSGVQAGVFGAGGITAPALKIRLNDPAYVFPLRAPAYTVRPASFFAVFRPIAGALPAAKLTHVFGADETNASRGIGYNVTTAGVIQLRETYGTGNSSDTGVALTSGKWYAVGLAYGAGTTRTAVVYNLTDQQYETTGAAYTGQNVTFGSSSATVNAFSNGNFDFAAGVILNASIDPAANGFFASLLADPWIGSRGGYAGGGTMTGTSLVGYDQTTTTIYFWANRPNLGTPAGYLYALHRSTTDPNFTPSPATRLGPLQASPLLSDSTLPVDKIGYYKLEQFDGSTTVYSANPLTARRSRGDFDFVLLGDSRGEWGPLLRQALFSNGYRTRTAIMNLGGTSAYSPTVQSSWQPNPAQDPTNGQAGTTLLANALREAADAGITGNVLFDLGTNDVGLNTSLANFQTYVGRIWAQLSGFGRIVVTGPFPRSGGVELARTKQYDDWLASQANGTTIVYTPRVVDYVGTYDMSTLSVDGVHLISTINPAHPIARAIFQLMEPTAAAAPRTSRSPRTARSR